MRELFPGFYERIEDELSMLWQKATFVFDTNMLLNVYRYQEETRERFFEILEQLKERIWTPHQAIYEFQNNRIEVIGQQLKVYSEISKVLKEAQALLDGLKYLNEKHSYIKIDEIIEDPMKALGEANKKLSLGQQKDRRKFENLKASDDFRERVTQLFQSRVGAPYKKDQMLDIYRQADKRFELQIPPGWKDKTKKTYGKYGDVILWFQLLEYARAHNKPILFITDDVKSDWFLSAQENNGKPLPRPELVQEMFIEAGVLLHIYQGYEFLDQATKFLNLTPELSISEDAKEVTERNALESETNTNKQINPGRRARDVVKALEPQVTEAIINWIKTNTDYEQIIPYPSSPRFPNIEIVQTNGPNKIGIKVKIEFDFIYAVREVEYILRYMGGAIQQYDKFFIFIVYADETNAVNAAHLIKREHITQPPLTKFRESIYETYFHDSLELYLPSNTSIVIGYFHEDSFTLVDGQL